MPDNSQTEISEKDQGIKYQETEDWKASVSAKEFAWFVGKATAGFTAAPLVLAWAQDLGITIQPGSIAAMLAPKLLPAVLGALLHCGQDWASLKTQFKWL